MPITLTTPWNKSYCRLNGTFSGTVETHFQVTIEDQDGTTFKWRKKTGPTFTWSSYTTGVSTSLNTNISLSDGMSVMFTRSSLTIYATGDSWKFQVLPDLLLEVPSGSTYTTGTIEEPYDNLETLENGDREHLIALSSKTGKLALIEDYNTDNPQVNNNIPTSLSANNDGYTMVKKNKELYVATGSNNNPMWIGYNKNDGFNGSTESYNFIQEPAYEQIDSTSKIDDVYTEGVALVCTGSDSKNSVIIAGFKENDASVYITNKAQQKRYSFSCNGQPLQIRENPNQRDSNGDINGFAVLVDSGANGGTTSLELWEVPITGTSSLIGQGANRTKVINFKKAEQSTAGSQIDFSDFLIVPSNADPSVNGTTFTLWISIGGGTETSQNLAVLFKYENIFNVADDFCIPANNWIDCTPYIGGGGASSSTVAGLANKFIRYEWYDNGDPVDGPDIVEGFDEVQQKFKTVQKHNLFLASYDNGGTNPQIGFTGELRGLKSDSGSQFFNWGDGLFSDGEKLWLLRWVTFLVGNASSGNTTCPMLAHLLDYGADNDAVEGAWASYMLSNIGAADSFISAKHLMAKSSNYTVEVTQAPSPMPLYAVNNTLNGGRKVQLVVDKATKNRHGFMYVRPSSNDPRLWYFNRPNYSDHYPYGSTPSLLHMFPMTYAVRETAFRAGSTKVDTGYNDGTLSSNKIYAKLVVDAEAGDSARYRLYSRSNLFTVSTGADSNNPSDDSPASTEGLHLGQPLDSHIGNGGTTERLVITDLNSDKNSTSDEYASSAGWISLEGIQEASADDWVGVTTQKVYYKLALLYDGFQESTLLSVNPTFKKSGNGNFDKAVQLTVRIQSDFEISNRISAIVLYRATDSAHDSNEPENLYRFVEEIPLYKFNFDASAGTREYTVKDNGNSDASYEALTGLSETLTNLNIKYSINTEVNGYHFVGNCNHSQFEDSENVIFRSQPGKYSIFDWSKDFLTINFTPKAMIGYLGKLYAYGNQRMSVINPQALVVEDEIASIGISNKKAMKVTPAGLFWFDNSNVYQSTPAINKIGTSIQTVETYGWNNLSDAVKEKAVIGYDVKRQALLIFFTTEAGENRCWAYSVGLKRWDLWDTSHKVYDTVDAKDGHPILLLSNGRICKYSSGENNKNWEWQSKKMSMGGDTIYKKIRVAKLDATNRNAVSIQYKANTAESDWQSGTDVSDSYGTTWKGKAIKVASNHSKLRWFKVKTAGTNTETGSNHKGNSIGIIYKQKKPK